MAKPLKLRRMTPADLPFADSLRAAVGWNQTLPDWWRLLAHEPDGCFVAEWKGRPAGTATTTSYGNELAWIGMVLVHPEQRRRGLGWALLDRCLRYLEERKIRCVKLDATPLGQPLYETLGFRAEWRLQRWAVPRVKLIRQPPAGTLEDWRTSDRLAVAHLDAAAFGTSRWGMLQALARQGAAVVHRSHRGRVDGYGMVRAGSRAGYLGPVVATTPAAASALIRQLAFRIRHRPIFWDIPEANERAVRLAQQLGFAPQRELIRMYRGRNDAAGDPARQWGIAAPEIG